MSTLAFDILSLLVSLASIAMWWWLVAHNQRRSHAFFNVAMTAIARLPVEQQLPHMIALQRAVKGDKRPYAGVADERCSEEET